MNQLFEVNLQPVGRRVEVPKGTTLLDAARSAGVELVAICGGEGVCGTCRVRVVEGELSDITFTEMDELTKHELSHGLRLACQAEVLGDVKIDIPVESITTPQRLQVEGKEAATEIRPAVVALDVELEMPTLADLRADSTRVVEAVKAQSGRDVQVGLGMATELTKRLRSENGKLRIAIRGEKIVAIFPAGTRIYGLAVDIGTTKLAGYLVDLENGEVAAKSGAMNPQIAYGEDVISRISYANEHAEGAGILQSRLVESLNNLAGELMREARIEPEQIVEGVLVGNTAMHHLLAGLPVKQLGESPYVAAMGEALEFEADEVGLRLGEGCVIYMPPNIAGYVGADHVAMLLGADLPGEKKTTIALDIGTNTEISLFHDGKHYACSCASGPAFEGAHIQFGMRAAAGAIERVRIDGDVVRLQTISNEAAVGICGSGILDIVAELIRNGIVERRGAMKGEHPNLRKGKDGMEFCLISAEKSGIGKEITVSRKDVNEIQLAKGAIRAGVEVLLATAGIADGDIAEFIVAGAFGTYLDVESAVRIGMFPNIPRDLFKQVGNAAGSGARKLLMSTEQRELADGIARKIHYVELATHADFMKIYSAALAFGN